MAAAMRALYASCSRWFWICDMCGDQLVIKAEKWPCDGRRSRGKQLRLGPHTHVESVLVHVLLKDGKSLLVGARVEAVRLAAGLLGRVGARDDRLEELDEAVTFPLVGGQAARRCVCIDVSCVDCVAGAGGRCGAGRWKPGRSDTPRDERERLVLDWTIGTIDVNE